MPHEIVPRTADTIVSDFSLICAIMTYEMGSSKMRIVV